MNQVLTPQDWMKLSAFLDGQLTAVEHEEVEHFCALYPTWRAGLSALEHTRILLRSAPKRGAPRNFTISEKIANTIRKPARGILPLRWVSVFSSAMAAVLLLIGFVSQSRPTFLPAAPAMAPESAAVMSEKAPAVAEPTLPPIIIWGVPGTVPQGYGATNGQVLGMGGGGAGGRGGGGGGGDGQDVTSMAPSMDIAPAPALVAPEITGNAAVPSAESAAPADTEPLVLPQNGPILGMNLKAPEAVSAVSVETTAAPNIFTRLVERPFILSGILLAIAAIITGIIAWRKPSRK